METSSTIIGLLIMALFAVPVFLMARSGIGGGRRFERDFLLEAFNNDLKVSEKDFWNYNGIGIDKSNNRIIYFHWEDSEKFTAIFNLSDVKVVETFPKPNEKNKKGFNYKKTERLGLRIYFKDPSRKDLDIVFYMSGFGQITDKDIKLFEKWSKIVLDSIDFKSSDDLKKSA